MRLNENGGIDPTINFGTGANGSVLDISIKPNFKILIGGGFTIFDGEEVDYFAQLHGGILNDSGRLEFTSSIYEVGETGTNAVVRIVRKGGLLGEVSVDIDTRLSTKPNPAVPGLDYKHISFNYLFSEGLKR